MADPEPNKPLQFLVKSALALDIDKHGFKGVFREGEFYTEDLADHWGRNEVLYWRYTSGLPPYYTQQPTQQPTITDDMVQRATLALLDVKYDPAPGVDWHCNRHWRVSEVREHMRRALKAALNENDSSR